MVWAVWFSAFLFFVGCAKKNPEQVVVQSVVTSDPLVGVWLASQATAEEFGGLQFDPEGGVHYLNRFTIVGDHWHRSGDQALEITSHQVDNLKSVVEHFVIGKLKPELLVLVPEGNLESEGATYYRAPTLRPCDRMIGRWTVNDTVFFDITPQGDGFRLLSQGLPGLKEMSGRVIPEGMVAEGYGRSIELTLIDGRETGRAQWVNKANCLNINGELFLCR